MPRCPVASFRKMNKYKLRLLWDLQNGPRRYGELKSGLLRGTEETKEIAPRVLSRELKALAASGLIARRDYGVVPPKVEYRLTPMGRSFISGHCRNSRVGRAAPERCEVANRELVAVVDFGGTRGCARRDEYDRREFFPALRNIARLNSVPRRPGLSAGIWIKAPYCHEIKLVNSQRFRLRAAVIQ